MQVEQDTAEIVMRMERSLMVLIGKTIEKDLKQKWSESIRAIFPTTASLDGFERDNPGMLPYFLKPLKKFGIINAAAREDLDELMRSSPLSADDEEEDFFELTFEDFLQNNLQISLNELATQLNQLVEQHNLRALFNDKKLGAAMFSRLKSTPADTAVKRNYLRILAFYMVWHEVDLSLKFHYEKLVDLCAAQPTEKGPHGVRIGFSINVVDIKVFKLLRKLLKECLEQSTLPDPIKINSLTLESMFALYIDIPNKISSDRISDTMPYGPGMREAVAISHQLLIKWQLSNNDHLVRPNLTVGIMAGKFSDLADLQPILSTKHQDDFPQIRISKFVKKCLSDNNVRTTLGAEPDAFQNPNEPPLYIWTVEGLWSWIYFRFLDEMIHIPKGAACESICLPNQYRPIKINTMFKTAIQHFYHNARNSLLGLEIAKTLYYRKDFANALEVLQAILREAPRQINALTLKMSIIYSQAASIDDPERSEFQFNRADDIAERIFHFHHCQEEDAFIEIGQGRLARAIQCLRQHRNKVLSNGTQLETGTDIEALIDMILSAEKAFIRGMNCTSTGHRSMYFILITRITLAILRSQAYRFTNEGIHITDPELFKATAHRLLKDFGWLPPSQPENDFSSIEKPLLDAIDSFGDAVRLQCFKANTNVGFAIMMHDIDPGYFPEHESKRIIEGWLNESLSWAQANQRNHLYTYTYARRGHGELLSCDEFKACFDVWMDIIENKKDAKLMFANMFR